MNLKDYKFNEIGDFILYLRSLIIIFDSNIKFYEIQLNELNKFIESEDLKGNSKKVVSSEIFESYRALLGYPYSQLVNIIGDQATFGASYQNYRKAIEKKSEVLKIYYSKLSLEEKSILNSITTARDWSSHIPVSLIHSTEKSVFKKNDQHSIEIPNFQNYEAEWIIDLYEKNYGIMKAFNEIFKLMKRDYSDLTKSFDDIVRFDVPTRPVSDLIIPKVSWEIQTKKIKSKDDIMRKYLNDEWL